MQTSTFALLAIAGASTAAVYATEPCDMGAIQGSLLPNGTAWHKSCLAATGIDVFKLDLLPTEAQAEDLSQSRDCVNYINQINQKANSAIQCEMTVGDQTVVLGELLTEFLKGETGNTTKEAVVGSDSMSGSVSLSSSNSTSGSSSEPASASESASSSSEESTSGSESAASAEKQASSSSSGKSAAKSGSSAVTTAAFSVVATAAATVLAFAL